ncbi:MAG: iron uptake porin [Cyanobacteria bacterium J06623_7]
MAVASVVLLSASKAIAGTNLVEQNKINSIPKNRQLSPSINREQTNKLRSSDRWLIAQTTNIQQLQDVRPSDWAYQALQNLIGRYGCISGFNDKTFRGTETVSRFEFTAGLNSCLTTIEKNLAQAGNIPQIDINIFLRLMQEFQAELAILQGRVDSSRAVVDDLEATQFSTTTKLQGEAVFGFNSILSGDDAQTSSVYGSRLRLDLLTSVAGDDLLLTRISQNNFEGFSSEIGTFQGNLAFATAEGDSIRLEDLHYSFNLGDRLGLIVGAAGLEADDIAPTINFLDGDGGSRSISRFGTRNPLYYSAGDAGIGINHRPLDRVEISAGYVASPANEPSSGSGLFDGPYSALGQITIEPFDSLSIAATYIYSYSQSDTATGTNSANLQAETEELFGEPISTTSSSYGLELSWAISDRLILGGWGGLSKVSNLNTLNQQVERGTQDIWNWAATLAIPDLGREGSLAGILVGSEPKVTNSTIDNLESDSEQSLHLEAFYQYRVSDNIAITPGVVWITEPDSNTPDNDPLVIGTLRTTFSF